VVLDNIIKISSILLNIKLLKTNFCKKVNFPGDNTAEFKVKASR